MATLRHSRVLQTTSFILIVLFCPFAHGKVIHVNDDGQADFDNIQAGIDAAVDGDTVLVSSGEYVIAEPITFRGKAITVMSEAGPDETTIRMGTPSDSNRGSVVIFKNGETAESILEGFTITGGSGTWVLSHSTWAGGGIFFDASSATVRNCAIVLNSAEQGGGLMVGSGSFTTLIDCVVVQNTAKNGGGVLVYSGSSTTLTNSIIRGNSATGVTFGVDGYGGGLFCGPSSSLTLTKCTITGNSAVRGGGGVHCWQNLSLALTNCAITNNTVQYAGGGILCDSGSAILTHCVIARNTRASWGGGIMSAFPEAFITINNCTICGNSATQGGGIGCFNGGSAKVTNSVILGNTASKGNEIYLEQAPTEFSVTHSNLTDRQAGLSAEGGSILNWGVGNIDADALFTRLGYLDDKGTHDSSDDVWVAGDYHLKSQAGRWDPNSESWIQDDVTSPCIDAGDPNSDWMGETWPRGERINMGAFGGTREASMSTKPEAMSLPRVAYVYGFNAEAAGSFQSLLMRYGCRTDLVGLDQSPVANLEDYDLIIVGDDTEDAAAWGDSQVVPAIEGSGRPIIGLGEGGYDFFGMLELSIGRPNGMHDNGGSIYAIDPDSSLFSPPYPIDVPEDGVIQLYTATGNVIIHLASEVPETVTVLAGAVDNPGYYPLVLEHDRYVFWGFTESPLNMTEEGKRLFINVVIRTSNKAWGS